MALMSAELEALRQEIAAVEPSSRAAAAVERIESWPIFGHRMGVVRDAIHVAAAEVERAGTPELEARLLLRLAAVQMAELDWDAADRTLASAGDRLGREGPLMFLVAARSCRVALRRGDHAIAGATLRQAAAHVARLADRDDPRWRRVLVELTLGIGEVAVNDEPGDPAPFDALRELVDELRAEPAWIDAVYTARQLLATDALARGDAATAAKELREVVRAAQDHGSPADEIEARLARAAALSGRGDRAGMEEAEVVVQIARDRALEHGLPDLHVAALIAQAGLMSQRGKTAGALDRCIEIARSGAAEGNLGRYIAAVGLMATIYQNHGDFPSAYRTIAESYHALREVQGETVKPMFTPLLETLRDRMGNERFAKMIDDVSRARRLADELTSTRA